MVFSKRSILLLCITAIIYTNAVNGQHKGAPNKQDTVISDVQLDIDTEALKKNGLVAEIEYDGDESIDIVLSPQEVKELQQGDDLLIDIPITESKKSKPTKEKQEKMTHPKQVKKVKTMNHKKNIKPIKKVITKVHSKPSKKQVKKDAKESKSNEQVKKYPYGSVTYITKSKEKGDHEMKVKDNKHEVKAEKTELSVQSENSEDISTKNGPTVVFAGILAAAVMTVGTVAAVMLRSRSTKESTTESENDVEDLDNLDQLESARANKTNGVQGGESDLEETEGSFIQHAVAV